MQSNAPDEVNANQRVSEGERRDTVKLKQKPEDFVVKESFRFARTAKGEHRVYLMDKQKLSTFEAIARLSSAFGVPRTAFSFCGLKDKQGRTEQLIAVRGAEVEANDPDLRLKFLGRAAEPLSAANTTSNRFGVTVRHLTAEDVARAPASIAEVNRLGVVNYFDSQRFGSLKHGQGFIAKDLLRGDFEAAVRTYMALPSELDRSNDAKVKAFWRDHWGEWRRKCTIEGAEKYAPLIETLRRKPAGFREAFLRIDPKVRAMLVFTLQSWLWNEGVRRLLVALLPGQSLLPLRYQAGKLLFPREAPAEVLKEMRRMTFPLLSPESTFSHPEVERAVRWVLGREKLELASLAVPGTKEIFFRHEERPLLVYPGRLMVGAPHPDELNRGARKLYLAFTLPPGSYATLVVRRVFAFTEQSNEREEPAERPVAVEEPMHDAARSHGTSAKNALPQVDRHAPARRAPFNKVEAGKSRARSIPALCARDERDGAPGVLETAREKVAVRSTEAPEAVGFRERQRRKKEQKARARAEAMERGRRRRP
jgi:tRNA pseudouridine13 synthase